MIDDEEVRQMLAGVSESVGLDAMRALKRARNGMQRHLDRLSYLSLKKIKSFGVEEKTKLGLMLGESLLALASTQAVVLRYLMSLGVDTDDDSAVYAGVLDLMASGAAHHSQLCMDERKQKRKKPAKKMSKGE